MKTLYAAMLAFVFGIYTNQCDAILQKNMADRVKTFLHKKGLRSKKSKRIATGVACICAAGAGAGSIAFVCYLWDRLHADKKTKQDNTDDVRGSSSQSASSDQSDEPLSDDEIIIENAPIDPIKTQEKDLSGNLFNFLSTKPCMQVTPGDEWGIIRLKIIKNKLIKNKLAIHFFGNGKRFGATPIDFENRGYKSIFQEWAQSQKDKKFKAVVYFYDNEGRTLKRSIQHSFKCSL